jgi:2-amino-4-hydroxy-6-hydroxymethyldihydropteridine diphosphokinase
MKTYLCLGSNMGNPIRQLEIAVAQLQLVPELELLRTSSIKNTPAYGYQNQADFFNQVVECDYKLNGELLLQELKNIEYAMGRVPTFRWGPRLIDLDILLLGDLVIETDNLIIPHPDMHNRLFVLQILDELIPDYRHPVLGKTIHFLKEKLESVTSK